MSDIKSSSAIKTPLLEQVRSRRAFLRTAALAVGTTAAASTVLTSCSGSEAKALGTAASGDHDEHGRATAAAPAAPTAHDRSEEMDRMHEAGIKSFPAPTKGKGNQLLAPRIDKGVKVFDLTARKIKWEVEPGKFVDAMAYNDQVPGPQIRVREGDRVRINLENELEESTAIHFHGLEVPFDQDGVPFITQPPVKPGASYSYEFVVPNAGSHMYHSHLNSALQVPMGLLGAFVVEPKNKANEPKVDLDYVMILNDGLHGFTLNGKSFPATEPIKVKLGQTLRLRYMNEGMMIHPMHLHGMHQTVIAKDGWDQPAPWKCDTLNIAPGERWDVIVKATNPGVWAFHCHILTHAEGQHGMFGMVTALIVEK
jgi:manganese oxidase